MNAEVYSICASCKGKTLVLFNVTICEDCGQTTSKEPIEKVNRLH